MAHACSHELEGIIAKNRNRCYRSGRTGNRLKIKCVQSDTFVIVGYEPSTALPGAIASLLLAARYRDGWNYVGSVGTGFKRDEARRQKKQLDKLKTRVPVVSVQGKNLVMTGPSLTAEIEYRAWTHTGTLRHASFKGLREEADWAEVYDWPVSRCQYKSPARSLRRCLSSSGRALPADPRRFYRLNLAIRYGDVAFVVSFEDRRHRHADQKDPHGIACGSIVLFFRNGGKSCLLLGKLDRQLLTRIGSVSLHRDVSRTMASGRFAHAVSASATASV